MLLGISPELMFDRLAESNAHRGLRTDPKIPTSAVYSWFYTRHPMKRACSNRLQFEGLLQNRNASKARAPNKQLR